MSRALGRYELLRPLARGGMGEVYLARRRAAGVEKWLVVKRMRPERAGDVRFLDLFKREARLSMSLAHQNIVPVFDFGRIDDQVFLAMERVEGKDLGSTLARAAAPLPPLLAAFVAAECCQALDYAHRRKGPDGAELGIVHRDITPRNVLLSWSGEVKITDFGIASLAGDQPSKMAGTPAYMAPEQARGEQLDPRADVYAVGLVLREAVTGERARKGSDREATIVAAKLGNLDPWPERFADSPLRAIADRATALAKEDRYPDARSMLEEIDVFMVAERAGKKGEAPARQLAAWLAEVWKDAREDEAIDAKIEAGELMSFLDDGGALDIIGTGTERSMAATAADDSPVPVRVRAPSGPATAPTTGSDAGEAPAPAPAASPGPAPSRARAKRRGLAAMAVAAAAAVAITIAVRGSGSPAEAPRRDVPAVKRDDQAAAVPDPAQAPRPDPHPVTAPAPAPTPVPVPAPEQDAAPAPTPTVRTDVVAKRAKLADQKKEPALPAGGSAGSATVAVPAPAPVIKRKVVINSQPWSYYTVDGHPTKHQTLETIELTPGPHSIHFTGNDYVRADKKITIVVPDRDGFKHFERLEPATTPAP